MSCSRQCSIWPVIDSVYNDQLTFLLKKTFIKKTKIRECLTEKTFKNCNKIFSKTTARKCELLPITFKVFKNYSEIRLQKIISKGKIMVILYFSAINKFTNAFCSKR